MQYIDVYEHCLLFFVKCITFTTRNFEASCKLLEEAKFWNSLFKQYILNGEYEKARGLGECIDNMLLCIK